MARTYNGDFDPATSYARISERVENQGKDIVDLRSNMNTGFHNLQSAIAQLTSELRGSSKTQWPVIWSAIGVSFTVLAAVGTLAYWPILSNQEKLEAAIVRVTDTMVGHSEKFVARQELDWRSARGAEDRTRSEQAIADIRAVMLPRAEWSERNLSRDHDIANIREDAVRDIGNLQRQIDLLRGDFQTFANSLGNGRDFILDLKDEVARLRDQLSEVKARQYQAGRTRSPP